MDRSRDKNGRFFSNSRTKCRRSLFFGQFNQSQQKEDYDHDYAGSADVISTYLELGAEREVDTGPSYDESWKVGRRIVELNVLAKNMYCKMCNMPLHLSDTVEEKRFGLGSILNILCKNSACNALCAVETGKRDDAGAFCINTKATIGMIHSGMGPTHVNSFLTECNLPPVADSTMKRHEKKLGQTMVGVASASCKKAQQEELELTSDKLQASFDAGWQKRGTGWNYNSNTGHASMIGKETGKVLCFDVRSKSCKICEYHTSKKQTIPKHDCSRNWTGTSKAMESDMAVAMAHRLKDDGCAIDLIHADNDSTTTSKLKLDFPDIKKKDDQNHIKKGFSKNLYELSKQYAELKHKDVIPYLVRCFMYAIKENKENESQLQEAMDRIVPHIYGSHDCCADVKWCTYKKDPTSFNTEAQSSKTRLHIDASCQVSSKCNTWCRWRRADKNIFQRATIPLKIIQPEQHWFKSLPDGKPLKNGLLRKDLEDIIMKYKKRSGSLLDLGSTQANENFNQLVSTKAPKSRHYGGSSSLLNRVSASVLQKNEGHSYLSKVNEAANLSPGQFTAELGEKRDRKRKLRQEKQKTVTFKKRRLQLKKEKSVRERQGTVKEGMTYLPQLEILQDHTDEEIPSPINLNGSEEYIFFDLETTGLGRNCDVTQIAAVGAGSSFQCYIYPRCEISSGASRVTGITFSRGANKLYLHGKEVQATSIHSALLNFIEYLNSKGNPVLVGHNIANFDIPVLTNRLREFCLYSTFCTAVKGFVDTLKMSRRIFPKSEVENYRQSTLVEKYLEISYVAHNAQEDVKALQQLFNVKLKSHCTHDDIYSVSFSYCKATYKDCLKNKAVSDSVCTKLSKNGISLHHLKIAEERDPNGLKIILQENKIPLKMANGLITHIHAEE